MTITQVRRDYSFPSGTRLPQPIRGCFENKSRALAIEIIRIHRKPSDNRQCQRWRIGKVIERLARLLDATATDARTMAKTMERGTERNWLRDRADYFRTVADRKRKRARRLVGGLVPTRRKTRER